jgi:hypothetical protein
VSPFDAGLSLQQKRYGGGMGGGPFSSSLGDSLLNGGTNGSVNGGGGGNPYEKWSNGTTNGGNDNLFQTFSDSSSPLTQTPDPVLELSSKLINAPIFPPKSHIKRQKMIYHCKFGEFGVMEGQFTEPSGVAVNAQNDIIVADTNNHR